MCRRFRFVEYNEFPDFYVHENHPSLRSPKLAFQASCSSVVRMVLPSKLFATPLFLDFP